MDVAAWLRGLGLEQYAQLFRDNDIDGEILYGMTAEDLKELGISSFGHRRRLVNAITALGEARARQPDSTRPRTRSSNPSSSSGESVANSVFAKALPSDFHRNVVLSLQEDAIGIRLRDAPPWRSH
jgi:hypothetical protein